MTLSLIGTTQRNGLCDYFVDAIDGGAGAGLLEIRTAGLTTLLATLTFSDPAFDAAGSAGGNADGVSTADPITDDTSADNTDTAATHRITTSTPTTLYEGDVNTAGADINFNSTSFTTGANVSITSMTVTMPASG